MASPARQYGKPAWLEELQLGSFRGVEFFTKTDTLETGRRVALHEYPYRDQPWPEDLGLATKFYEFDAYLWADETEGEVVWELRNALLAACEAEGEDELVHPSLGAVTCQLMTASFLENADGGVVQVRMRFVESKLFEAGGLAPFATPDTINNVLAAANNLIDGAANTFRNIIQGSPIQLLLGL